MITHVQEVTVLSYSVASVVCSNFKYKKSDTEKSTVQSMLQTG